MLAVLESPSRKKEDLLIVESERKVGREAGKLTCGCRMLVAPFLGEVAGDVPAYGGIKERGEGGRLGQVSEGHNTESQPGKHQRPAGQEWDPVTLWEYHS